MNSHRTLTACVVFSGIVSLGACSSGGDDSQDAPTPSATVAATSAAPPTTIAPTTVAPTTVAPSSTAAPTTIAATTVAPTTVAPSSTAPTTTVAASGSRLELVRTIAPDDGFDQPAFAAIDDQSDRLYVVDSANRRIVSFALDGTDATVILGGGEPLLFRSEGLLGAVDVDADGSLFAAESGTSRILHMSPDGEVLSEFTAEPAFGRLFSLSLDAVNGLVYAVDDELDSVVVFDRDGREVRRLLSSGSEPGQGNDVGSVEVLADGSLWLADAGNGRVQHLAADGTVLQVIGPFAEGEVGYMKYPNDVAVDPQGRVWVADYNGGSEVVFAPDGTALARFGGEADDVDGWLPVSLTFSDTGQLYLTERTTSSVYVYDVVLEPVS